MNAPGEGPRTLFIRSERERAVMDAIERLEPRHRAIVIARFYWDLSWNEVAEEVGAVSAAALMKEFRTKVLPALGRLLGTDGDQGNVDHADRRGSDDSTSTAPDLPPKN
jgi:hypothetical protein